MQLGGKRRTAFIYATLSDKFSFLTDGNLSVSDITTRAAVLVQSYSTDWKRIFVDEFLLFQKYVR